MTRLEKTFKSLAIMFVKVSQLNRANRISCGLSELFAPTCTVRRNNESYFIYTPNNLTRWRAKTYFTKEPETIEWIDTFKEGDVLFDIGANIGLYSIYAAKKGVNVVAFEPESQNYALINKNIYLNGLSQKILCLNIALSDEDAVDYLHIPVFQGGGAMNCFGKPIDWKYEGFAPVYSQGINSYTLDSFLKRYSKSFPTHIKIDVDGIEPKIIRGAEITLSDKRLKSIFVEINQTLPEHVALIDFIQSRGLSLEWKRHSEMIEDSPFRNVYNCLFLRK